MRSTLGARARSRGRTRHPTRFVDELRARRNQLKLQANLREQERLSAAWPSEDAPNAEFAEHFAREHAAAAEGKRLVRESRRLLEVRFGEAPRPRRRILPRGRQRPHRPRRRASSSSRTSGPDPGDADGPGEAGLHLARAVA